MTTLVAAVHWLAALIVLAESLNKLERADLRSRNATLRGRLAAWLAVGAWTVLAAASAGVLVAPFTSVVWPVTPDSVAVWGIALWVVSMRTRARRSRADDDRGTPSLGG